MLGGLSALSAVALAPPGIRATAADPRPDRMLVVVELAGGNDGLDTVIPYDDDAYHRARPALRAAARGASRLDDYRALHPALEGFRRRWDAGQLAIVEGCGHADATRCHFAAMQRWHHGATSVTADRGWLGRLADDHWPTSTAGSRLDPGPTFVNIGATLSPALRSRHQRTMVFSDPERSLRCLDGGVAPAARRGAPGELPATAIASRAREAIRDYRTPIDYGSAPLAVDLRRVAALIAAGFASRVYYTGLGGFDTHAAQAGARPGLLRGVGDGLDAFHRDLRRLGRDGDVATMVFSEFGRRLEENASGGTDHGAAGPVFLLGAGVVPGLAGARPSLTELDANGGLAPTTDFRRVYTSVAEEWLGCRCALGAASERFEPLRIFA